MADQFGKSRARALGGSPTAQQIEDNRVCQLARALGISFDKAKLLDRASQQEPIITLRDRMAMAALTGICMDRVMTPSDVGYESEDKMAARAWRMADALLAARGKS